MTPFLEIGANAGHTSYMLANEFGAQGYALDISADALRHGIALQHQWNYAHAPIRIAGDGGKLPFRDNSIRFIMTFQTLSQHRIGAARTAPLLTTTPLFGLVIAAVTLGQIPRAAVLLAIAAMLAGAYVLSGGGSEARGLDAVFGIATAAMWATSAVLTLEALEGLPSPLLGVTVGMLAAVPSYAVALLVHRRRHGLGGMARASFALKIAAAVLLALATWWRLLAPLVVGRRLEAVTIRLWVGAALVMTGTLSLIAVENA